MRVITGAIGHETSTFTTVATTWASYREQRFGYLVGDEIISKFSRQQHDHRRIHLQVRKRTDLSLFPRYMPTRIQVVQHREISSTLS